MPKYRNCQQCDAKLPLDSSVRRIYCSDKCRKDWARHRAQIKKRKSDGGKRSQLTPGMRDFRALMEIEDEFVRETLQQAIRDVVTEAITDNLVGAGEILTGMLPKALAGIAIDLESKDWMIRSRAQAAVMKYAMEFRDKDGKDKELGNINVTHQVLMPDTPLGRATAGEVKVLEAEAAADEVEAFEADWQACSRCHERKHPDAMRENGVVPLCSSCVLARGYTRGNRSPTGMHDSDPEFGG